MALTEWLIDTSALLRLEIAVEAGEWTRRVERGLVRIGTVTKLEIGYSTRSAGEHRGTLERSPLSAMPVEYLTVAAEDRAIEVQRALAQAGRHRAPSVPDLLLAATAEVAGLTILHVDKDFDLIAEVTGQPVERLTLEPPQ